MKKIALLLLVGIIGGVSALSIQSLTTSSKKTEPIITTPVNTALNTSFPNTTNTPVKTANRNFINTDTDLTVAAKNTVNAVVHVKNVSIYRKPRNYMEYLRNGGKLEKAIVGAGSGVIISNDGYIVTNKHVIEDANELKVTLNNNKTYDAKLIGADESADIAVLKIVIDEENEKFNYLTFANSDNTKIGEWVLAVGNPFNLTSTVTAGIISAKSRDLNEYDTNMQSFIQTDAAINPGNSGGALVNTKGELIGINTLITSQTGSYVGYAFAVPSNNVQKIVQDILEFGDVQKAILGISGGTLSENAAKELGLKYTQGVYVSGISKNSGAEKSGIKKGDIITKIDGYKISKFSDLSSYVNSKRPKDILNVSILRDEKLMEVPVTLSLYETYVLKAVGVEVVNADEQELKKFKTQYGVKISKALSPSMKTYGVEGIIITEIDNKKVTNINDVKRIMKNKNKEEDIMVSFLDQSGEKKHFVFN